MSVASVPIRVSFSLVKLINFISFRRLPQPITTNWVLSMSGIYYLPVLQAGSLKAGCRQGQLPPIAPGKLCPLLSQPQQDASIPWLPLLMASSLQSPLPSSHHLFYGCLRFLSFLCKAMGLIQDDSPSSRRSKYLFPKKVTFLGSQDPSFWRSPFNPLYQLI